MLTSLALTFILASSGLAAVVPTILARSDVTDVTFTGSGCPPGSAYTVVGDATPSMVTAFSYFSATVASGVDPSESSKSCTVSFKVPQGFVYTYESLVKGVSLLENGVTGTSVSTFSVNGNVIGSESSSVSGPTDVDPFTFTGGFVVDSSAQDSVVAVTTEINLDSTGSGGALMIIDTIDLV